MSRQGALLFQICERILGLSALLGALGIYLGDGVNGDFWREQFGVTLDDPSLTVVLGTAITISAIIFLVPLVSQWVHQRRSGIIGLLNYIFVYLCAGAASVIAAITFAHGFPQFDTAENFKFFAVLACAAVHLIRQLTVAVREPRKWRQEVRTEEGLAAPQTNYRIISTPGDYEATASIEERRRRMIYRANFDVLPPHVRDGLVRISRLRAALCGLILAPVFIVVALAIYGVVAGYFLPTRELSELAISQMGPFLFYCVVAGAYFAAFGPRMTTRQKRPRNRIVMGAVFAILLAMLGRFSFYAAITSGAPDLHAHQSGGPAARAAVLVISRGDDSAAFCGRWADIRVAPGAPLHRMCGLDGHLVDKIASGDRLLVSGIATKYGIRYYDIRY